MENNATNVATMEHEKMQNYQEMVLNKMFAQVWLSLIRFDYKKILDLKLYFFGIFLFKKSKLIYYTETSTKWRTNKNMDR